LIEIPFLGCWRNFANLNQKDLMKIPKKWTKLPLEVLATINVNPPTAYRLLKDFRQLRDGDLVVQNGANSAVGRLVIQMASIMGAKTINVIRDRVDYEEVAKELMDLDPKGGATVVKSDNLKDLKGLEAKLGLNCVGGGAVLDMSRVMGQNGVIVTYGAMSRRPLIIPAGLLIFKNLSLNGFWVSEWYKKACSEARSKMIEDILEWYGDGRLKPVKSFWMDIGEEQWIKEFVKDSCEGKVSGKGKCIIKL
jgi:mitochondrial enoyl-[acyl-carrier protein] reductase / trans-2-enoyl-CoA reductase